MTTNTPSQLLAVTREPSIDRQAQEYACEHIASFGRGGYVRHEFGNHLAAFAHRLAATPQPAQPSQGVEDDGLEIAAQYHDQKAAHWQKEAQRHYRPSGNSPCMDRDNRRASDHKRFAEDLRTLAKLRKPAALTQTGESALGEAVSEFVRLEKSIMADIGTAHDRGSGASSAMREGDRDMRAELRHAFGLARAALSHPVSNQFATDVDRPAASAQLGGIKCLLCGGNGLDSDNHKVCEYCGGTGRIEALSTSSAKPEAASAENGLREDLERCAELLGLLLGADPGPEYASVAREARDWWHAYDRRETSQIAENADGEGGEFCADNAKNSDDDGPLRIAIWNACRNQGLSQDRSIAIVADVVAKLPAEPKAGAVDREAIEAIFREDVVEQGRRLGVVPQPLRSPGGWMMDVRKAAILKLVGGAA